MRTTLLPLLIAAFTGCVTQSTYDALKLQSDQTAASLGQREKELAETRRALQGEEAKAADLGSKMAQLEAVLGDAQKDKSALETALDELGKRKAETEGRIAEFRALLDKFKRLIDSGKLKVRIRDGRMFVELATDILFTSGSATLSKDGQLAIAEVAALLTSIPERHFQVEGHTDNVRIRGVAAYKSNWELASARAITVLKAMTDAGMPPERLSAASFGETRPAKGNDTPEDRAANRRIEIVLLPDLSSLPGFDELQRVAP